MSSPSRNTTTNSNQVVVNWFLVSSIISAGGSSVTSYNLYWDAGTSGVGWYSVIGLNGPYTDGYYIITTSIQQGVDYQFKIRA